MNRIAYVINWPADGVGIIDKVFRQIRCWHALGAEVKLFYLSDRRWDTDLPITFVEKPFRSNLLSQFWVNCGALRSLGQSLSEFGPDVVYLRNGYYHPYLDLIIRKYVMVMELNSMWLQEAHAHRHASRRRLLLYYYLKLTQRRIYRSASGIVTVTNEIATREAGTLRKNTPVCVVPNSIDVGGTQLRTRSTSSDGLPVVIFVAGPIPVALEENYHGVDKILRLARATIGRLRFRLVGDSSRYGNDIPQNVTLEGVLSPIEVREAIATSDIGLGTTALHRKAMIEACPLKLREYLAQGLPVIVPYADTAFAEEVPKWVLSLPNTEENLTQAVDDIVSFCEKWAGKKVPSATVEPFVDAKVLETRRLAFLREVYELNIGQRAS